MMNYPKKIILSLLLLPGLFLNAFSQISQHPISLNQLGYLPHQKKIAVYISDHKELNSFEIISFRNNRVLFSSKLQGTLQSSNSLLQTRIVDFTEFQVNGTYRIVVGTDTSYSFEISDTVYSKIAKASIKAFYFQRASMPLEEKYAEKWKRNTGHPDTSVLVHSSAADNVRKQNTILSTPGGWYDAGDYNKYIVNSGISMGTLLSAYEDNSSYFKKLQLNIPESDDTVPDILNEIVYNLRWMLTMQDPNDGGVYHKCTNAGFDGMIMPDKATSPRYVVQKSSAAALDFSAVTAQAARLLSRYKEDYPDLSDSCISASEKAWKWAMLYPDSLYNQARLNQHFSAQISTGDYGDGNINDEKFWAACELFITTQQKKYYDTALALCPDTPVLQSWGMVSMMGYYSIIRSRQNLPGFASSFIENVERQIVGKADKYITAQPGSAFDVVMGTQKNDFTWGSNAVAANQGMLLLNAYRITKNKSYFIAATDNLDYLLGRNATGYCFVTGFGEKSPLHPHHRQSESDGIPEPVPGLLVGGPNPGMQDKCHYVSKAPETAYADDVCSFASNEIAINWNAPLVYLLSTIVAMRE